ncbi:MAG: hypothetical protein H3C30_16070 [Candidatus Hydrogenedentes bacterium]|nr:hypothetical protein [Candidatus Hydrogenedentota bacterium]
MNMTPNETEAQRIEAIKKRNRALYEPIPPIPAPTPPTPAPPKPTAAAKQARQAATPAKAQTVKPAPVTATPEAATPAAPPEPAPFDPVKLARAIQAEEPGTSLPAALLRVRNAHPEEYARFTRGES